MKPDTRLRRDLDSGSEHPLRAADDIERSKQPHSVDQTDETLLAAARCHFLLCVSIEQEMRRARYKVGIDHFPLCDLAGGAMKALLAASDIKGGHHRGTAADEGAEKRGEQAQESWIDRQSRLQEEVRERPPVASSDSIVMSSFNKSPRFY